jgi:hypothetical protein
VAPALTDEVFMHQAHVRFRIVNAQKVGGLVLTFGVLAINFGKVAQKAKGQDHAQMRFDFKIHWSEKVGAVRKPKIRQ